MSENSILGFPGGWGQYFASGVMPADNQFPLASIGARWYRRRIIRPIDTNTPITPLNPIARWKVPSSGNSILDFRRGGIWITVNCTATNPGANPCFSNLIWNLVDRFRVEQGGNLVLDQRYFNLQETLYYNLLTEIDQRQTTATTLWGAGSINIRKARAAGHKYFLPIPTNALTKSVLPWFVMQRAQGKSVGAWQTQAFQDVFLQWDFAKPEACIETDIASPVTWQITSMEIEYEELQLYSGLSDFMTRWHTFPWKYPKLPYRTTTSGVYEITTASEQLIQMDIKVTSLISIFVTFRRINAIEDTTIRNRFEDYLGKADMNLMEWQWQLNGTLTPERPVNCTDNIWSEPYKIALTTVGKYHGRGPHEGGFPVLPGEFVTGRFVLCLDTQQHPFTPGLINPVSTSRGNTQVQLRLKFQTAPAAGIQAVVHCMHWKIWNIGSTGDVPITEV